MIDKIIQLVIAEAEQACRYALKFNLDHMEESPYKDGFELGCNTCEGAISRHIAMHMDRIKYQLEEEDYV